MNYSADKLKQPIPMVCEGGDYLPHEVTGEDFVLWAHCSSGMSADQFVAWLKAELDFLNSIDPICSK